jgi:hypothetical protein
MKNARAETAPKLREEDSVLGLLETQAEIMTWHVLKACSARPTQMANLDHANQLLK